MDTARLALCSHGTVMSDAVLISEGGWELSREGLTEGLAPWESWPTLALLSQCVCLGATLVNYALTLLRKDFIIVVVVVVVCGKDAFSLRLHRAVSPK